jgi:hypothetical protein
MKENEIAWAAGFFEGEGSISWQGGPRLQMTSTDKDVLLRVQKVFGGEIYELNGGVPRSEDVGRYPSRKVQWKWCQGGYAGLKTLLEILPWLGERRTQKANEVMRMCRDWNGHKAPFLSSPIKTRKVRQTIFSKKF